MTITAPIWKSVAGYRHLLAIADRLTPAFRRAFLAALATTTDGLDPEAERALLWGDARAWQTFTEKLDPGLRAAVQSVVVQSGQATINAQPASVGMQLRFDLGNPYALEAVDTVVGQAVTQITAANKEAIQTAVRRGFLYGLGPAAMSQRIRDYIGLTPRDVTAVENYRASVLGTDVGQQRADTLASAYAGRLLRQRATVIARTETMRASNAGQQAAWRDAQANQLLMPGVRQQWVVTRDDRLCPICEAIPRMNPGGITLEESFASTVGSLDAPPAHPQCRCVTILVNP